MKQYTQADAARSERAASLAKEILEDARGQILLEMPYFMEAVSHFRALDSAVLRPARPPGTVRRPVRFGTDGTFLYYDPEHVLAVYRSEEHVFTRDYLHSLLHCLFLHPFCDERTALPGNREIWDLACDIATEALIGELGLAGASAEREGRQSAMLHLLTGEIGRPLSAERIFRWLRDKRFSEEELAAERLHFLGDQHMLWYRSPGGEMLTAPEERDDWRDTARRMQILAEETEAPENALLRELRRERRAYLPYEQLIRRFMSRSEVLESADEFDYVYYTYGLRRYRNIPLIEPLEYKEDSRIRSCAVAVDTSGSISEETAAEFVAQTCSLLLSEELFAEKMEIHLLFCDDRIREEIVIRNREQLTAFMERPRFSGRGGTDFRPVFERCEQLAGGAGFSKAPGAARTPLMQGGAPEGAALGAAREGAARGVAREFRGLLYFTDGQGIFPAKAPSFETLFILSREDAAVPGWAMRYVN